VTKLDDLSKTKNLLKIFIDRSVVEFDKNPLSKDMNKECQSKFKMLVLLDLVHNHMFHPNPEIRAASVSLKDAAKELDENTETVENIFQELITQHLLEPVLIKACEHICCITCVSNVAKGKCPI
jgi:hypothetical protein